MCFSTPLRCPFSECCVCIRLYRVFFSAHARIDVCIHVFIDKLTKYIASIKLSLHPKKETQNDKCLMECHTERACGCENVCIYVVHRFDVMKKNIYLHTVHGNNCLNVASLMSI